MGQDGLGVDARLEFLDEGKEPLDKDLGVLSAQSFAEVGRELIGRDLLGNKGYDVLGIRVDVALVPLEVLAYDHLCSLRHD